ncbi:MazG-like protein [Streptococcus caviae]|uniref:30S ribosomal protein S15 n=1 Tax=Streptococcus sp. 'caviae' TaxID=1915004 RepID=UPI00094B7E06|nr:30S ribosomal protein S15 [Streptococcus sp. 'caviae']OLN83595.1 30S ribosomal protein S15 [Streptococcus sp. 'caviae']
MYSDDWISRSVAIRKAYHQLEEKHHGQAWSIEEDLLALGNDIGNLNRLVMTKQGRYYDETPYQLEQKLAEAIWWLLELSQRLDIDIRAEMETFLSDKEKHLNLQNKME